MAEIGEITPDLEKLKIKLEDVSTKQEMYIKLINILDVTKRRKEALKILNSVSSDTEFFVNIENWLLHKMSSNDINILKKVCPLMELSNSTRDIVRRNFMNVCEYIVNLLSMLCDENQSHQKIPNSEDRNEWVIYSVKLCLKMIQILPETVSDVIFSEAADNRNECWGKLLTCVLTILSSNIFKKDCSLLAGTTLALFFNLDKIYVETLCSIQDLLSYLVASNVVEKQSTVLNNITIKFPKSEPSKYSILLFINGFVTTNSHLLLENTLSNGLLLDYMFKLINVENYPDPVSKYLCFQTLLAWLEYIKQGNMTELLRCMEGCGSLFMTSDSYYCYQIINMVWKHIEDLISGIPSFVRRIFSLILKLHNDERKERCDFSQDQFYVKLTEDVLKQPWHVKGRWLLLTELIPFVSFKKIISFRPCLVDELIQCLKTCGLTSISNEVYQSILKDMTNSPKDEEGDANKEWSLYFSTPVMNALQSDNIILRQNIGQYWIPSTLKMLPDGLLITEREIRYQILDEGIATRQLLHAFILILKSCRSFALIKNDHLEKCKDILSKALQHTDLDVRLETFTTLCSNPKKTDPLPISFQYNLLSFVKDNLNNDSSRFRQQMISSLKKLLLNVRDSSVLLHRKYINGHKKCFDENSKHLLKNLIDFVRSLLEISKSCLHPGARFQRKKTGLLLFQLLSDLFIYVENEKKRKKGAAPDSSKAFFIFLQEDKSDLEIEKLDIVSKIDIELLSCIEDQHDEIRDLALEILNYHQEISEDHLLKSKETFNTTLKLGLSLLNSPKYQETESGAIIMRFIFDRLVENNSLIFHLIDFDFDEKIPNCAGSDHMLLCYFLLERGKRYCDMADKDFLLAACHRPIFGILMAFSQILHCFAATRDHHYLAVFIKELLMLCNSISSKTVYLLSGTYVCEKNAKDDCAETSPSFADIDGAVDTALENSPSYSDLKESLGHLHCRELLVSFCWLNLKAISYVLVGVGNLAASYGTIKPLLDKETLGMIYDYYKNSLIKCRHKGVIEASFSSLTSLSKKLACITLYWNEMKIWCSNVLHSAVDISPTVSVTKRSAGIPMFIQAIISAEPSTENKDLLVQSLKYLQEVAKNKLPKHLDMTVDLPQFNAINIMKAIFRDASLGNAVLPMVEDAVMLTINGFSSVSWSIRSASTILLGTLVPRMLGQRISQEESNLQNTCSVDVFFYRYPKLVSYFLNCLESQNVVDDGYKANFIAPHIMPVLTFLSKLSSGEKSSRLSTVFLPILHSFLVTPVFSIREMITISILTFKPEEEYRSFIEDILLELQNEKNNNKIHGLCMMLLKTIKIAKNCKKDVCLTIVRHYKDGGVFTKMNCDLLSLSVTIDILVECYKSLKDVTEIVLKNLNCKILFTEKMEAHVGRTIFLKSLAKAVIVVLSEEQSNKLMDQVESCKCYDLYLFFFKYVYHHIADIKDCHLTKILHFNTKVILETKLETILESSLICFYSILNERTFSELCNVSELLSRLIDLLSSIRLLPFLLPLIEKLLNVGKSIQLKSNDYLMMIDIMSEFIERYSCSEVGEDLRCAAARTLGLFQQLVIISENEENAVLVNHGLKRVLSGAVKLLQDEDEAVRMEANSRLQLLTHYYDSQGQSNFQCNITLKNLFKFVEVNAVSNELYFTWLLEFLIGICFCDRDEKSDMMLFEQEASNLYAEEIVIINLTFMSLEAVLTEAAEKNEYFTSLQNEFHMVFMKDIEGMNLRLMDTKLSALSVYGIIGKRKCFLTIYRLLEWLNLFCHHGSCEEKMKFKKLYIDNLVSMVGKCRLPPILKTNYDKVISQFDTVSQ